MHLPNQIQISVTAPVHVTLCKCIMPASRGTYTTPYYMQQIYYLHDYATKTFLPYHKTWTPFCGTTVCTDAVHSASDAIGYRNCQMAPLSTTSGTGVKQVRAYKVVAVVFDLDVEMAPTGEFASF